MLVKYGSGKNKSKEYHYTMNNLQSSISDYLEFCKFQKRLDSKTLKAYKIDLTQFERIQSNQLLKYSDPHLIEYFISLLHKTFKPKTVKRKIACEISRTIDSTENYTPAYN
jgi:site-specific recombinase XerD